MSPQRKKGDFSDRPRAKGVGVPLASRRGCSRGVSTKKRADLGSSCHVGHGNATFVVDTTQLSKVPKITCDVSDRKPAPTGQEKFFGDFFFVESTRTQPEATDRHRQSPLRVHSNSPKNRRLAAGGSVHRPFSSGSVRRLRARETAADDQKNNGGSRRRADRKRLGS